MHRHGQLSERKAFVNGTTGDTLFAGPHIDKGDFSSYPLPRQALRRAFFKRLAPQTVRFGVQVTDVAETPDGVVVVTAAGDTLDAHYVFACDGINSVIRRRLLPQLALRPFGLGNVYGSVSLADSSSTKAMFHAATVQVLDGTHRLFSKPFNSACQMWEMTWPAPDCDVSSSDVPYSELQVTWLAKCREIAARWKVPEVHELLERTQPADVIVHALFDLDPEAVTAALETASFTRVIFLGDTLHPMAPYIGMGANQCHYRRTRSGPVHQKRMPGPPRFPHEPDASSWQMCALVT